MTYLPIDQEAEVDSVVGAYMQVRREAIEAIGLLGEVFFMYGEDLDWALRISARTPWARKCWTASKWVVAGIEIIVPRATLSAAAWPVCIHEL